MKIYRQFSFQEHPDHYYKFDETSGTVVYNYGKLTQYSGINAGAYIDQDGYYSARCYKFRGSDSYKISINNSGITDPLSSTNFTVMLAAKVENGFLGLQRIFQKKDTYLFGKRINSLFGSNLSLIKLRS